MRYTLAAVILAVAATASVAQDLPPPVAVAIAEAKKTCSPDPTTLKPGFIKRQDVNGDGVPDFILDYGRFQCGDNITYWCGSAGCTMQIFASSDGRFIKVLDENVQEVRFRKIGGRSAMLLGLHGSACGKAGVEPCGATLYWNGTKFSPAH
ncbi:hypothetical protein MKL09_26770 [Methylobacterium sp. J-048]|uniref:hypothetical protein n=1 Tax=Methylobacterium sp. J-048 TaxID=2836635 RepID=UPI001FBB166E|nr:hypothetical protein [Methylobacterium sp. J-048]MCJ2060121.1 hypothetical protein [Methylobacterium sp. J-048]